MKFTFTPDKTLPIGWTLASSRNYNQRSPYVIDAEGNLFRSRRKALKHLIDTRGKDEDIKNLRESIKSQGWSDLGEQLPGLWLVRVEGNQLTFITESGDVVRGLVRAEIYLHQHSSDLKQDLKKVRSLKIDRSQEDHITVDVETIKTEG